MLVVIGKLKGAGYTCSKWNLVIFDLIKYARIFREANLGEVLCTNIFLNRSIKPTPFNLLVTAKVPYTWGLWLIFDLDVVAVDEL